uniref:Wsv194 n=1 Tax=White spot syndrome virus TaxID=92652 RepID=A0A2U9GC49_WSSV|nr:wsv194 [Shrimp white spot syndrome virus]
MTKPALAIRKWSGSLPRGRISALNFEIISLTTRSQCTDLFMNLEARDMKCLFKLEPSLFQGSEF